MEVSSNYGKFSIQDLLTKIIPGFIIILPFLLSLTVEYQKQLTENSTILGFVILGLSYIFGIIIEHLQSTTFRVPSDLRIHLADHFDIDSYVPLSRKIRNSASNTYLSTVSRFPRPIQRVLPSVDRFEYGYLIDRYDWEFKQAIKEDLELNIGEDDIRAIYDLLLIHMDGKLSERTLKYKLIRQFDINMRISASAALILYVVALVIEQSYITIVSTIIIFILSFLVLILHLYLGDSGYYYTDLLIKEYYYDRVSRCGEDGKPS
ncbi:hypothetical protein [Halorhabdus sp. BNX81]|uniref:hypothetical protein n=1 Tax=Halorhabdus sp. BNX81 TaxID=2980181 RepID=UPI0023DD1095|nr:hypothetical protein [Halorhabdus sp. BNX81]